MHAWTQSDRYAIALMFLENGFNLFKPQTFNLETIEGVIATDFPIVEYITALIMKLSGNKDPIIFRGFLLSLSIIGHLFLYKTARLNKYAIPTALWIMVFSFTMPILLHYQAGFIPSVSAYAFFLIGLFFASNNWKDNLNKSFYWAIGFFLLAALLRKPFVLFAFAFSAMHFFPIKKNKRRIIASCISAAIFLSYFFYNTYLANKYGSALLTSATGADGIGHWYTLLLEVANRWKWDILSLGHYIILFFTLIVGLFYGLSINKKVFLIISF